MDDFTYEVRERKKMIDQGKHRKNGSGSRRCFLPSDNLTERQIQKLHREVVSFNMNKPMDWKTFRALPPDLKKEYIDKIVADYAPSAQMFAEMLGTSYCNMFKKLKEENVKYKFSQRRQTDSSLQRWNDFRNLVPGSIITNAVEDGCNDGSSLFMESGWTTDSVDECNATCKETQPAPQDYPQENEKRTCDMTEFSIVFTGMIDLAAITNSLRVILGDNSEGKITIKVEK